MVGTPQAQTQFRRLALFVTATIKLLHIHGGPRLVTNTTQRRKKALIIGINYKHNEGWRLNGPQADVFAAKSTLITVFQLEEHEITILSDDNNTISMPTKDNIMEELEKFVVDGEPGVDYIFIYAGHSAQFAAAGPSHQGEEEDHAECIVPLDAIRADIDNPLMEQVEPNEEKVIFDYDLHRLLVKRLGKDSQLTAIFDSCHSATLLNLKHHKCNRLGRWTSEVRRVARRVICDRYGFSFVKLPVDHGPSSNVAALLPRYRIKRSGTHASAGSAESQGLCTGLCCQLKTSESPRVYCISACKDHEEVYEDPDGKSMLHSILQLLGKNQTPTFHELMTTVHENAKSLYNDAKMWHKNMEKHKSKDHFLLKRLFQRAKAHREVKRWYPQLSSTAPVNMDSKLVICNNPRIPCENYARPLPELPSI